MKRLAFRIAVAILTFFLGVVSTKVSHHKERLNSISTIKQSFPITEIKPQPATLPQTTNRVISDRLRKIGALPETLDESDFVSLQFIDEEQGWLVQGRKLWRTTNGGRSWKVVFTSNVRIGGRDGSISNFQFINAHTGWLISTYKMYKTEDGGNTWNVLNQPIPYNYDDGLPVGIINFKFLKDGKRGWVLGDEYRPITRKERKLGFYPYTRYASIDDKKVLASLIYYTDDGGHSWSRQHIVSNWYDLGDIYALDEKHAWAVGLAGVSYLQNGRWMPVKSDAVDDKGYPLVNSLDVAIGAPTDSPCSVYFINPRVGWIVNSNGYIGKSVDGGRTWSDVSSDTGGDEISMSRWGDEVYFTNSAEGWQLDRDGKLKTTTDGGVSWTKVEDNITFSDMFFLDAQHGWAVSKEGLYRIILKKQARL
jgi:photosystem II stability/assembly factor-like uncharacterized protein